MKKFLFLLLMLPLLSFADTIQVKEAFISDPIIFQNPYFTQHKNLSGKTYQSDDILNQNASLLQTQTNRTIHRNDTITTTQPSLSVIKFNVRTDQFVKANIDLSGLKKYKLYCNEQPCGNPIDFLPGDTKIALLVYADSATKNTFNIQFDGTLVKNLSINPNGKSLWSQSDMLYGPHYAAISISPKGKFYSYAISEQSRDGSKEYTTYLKETKTNKTLRFWPSYTAIRWLPNTDLLYNTVTKTNGTIDLVSIDPTTGVEKTLAKNIPNGVFDISPNLDYLIYIKEEKNDYPELAGTHRIFEPDNQIPGWRKRNTLYLYSLNNHSMQQLIFGRQNVNVDDISHDGSQLLISYSTFNAHQSPFYRTTALIYHLQSQKVDTILANEPFIASMKFSQDDKNLIVKASPWAFNKIGCELTDTEIPNSFDYRLYNYNLTAKKAKPLLVNFTGSVRNFNILENNTICFDAENQYNVSLYTLNLKNMQVTQLQLPVSYVQDYDVSENRTHPLIILRGQSTEEARQLLIGEIGKKLDKTGNIDFKSITKSIQLPKCNDWNFVSSRGDSIHNFYFLPGNFDATKKYPMIVYYYGGCVPTPKLLEGFWPLSALSSQGYVVLVLEPSGATGFGQKFAAKHVNTWGDGSSDDIIEGVKEFCRTHPYVDAHKIGCMGASYGGFMTQYLVTKTPLFAAAISHAGISDITGYWGGGYWGYSYGETAEYGNFPWSNKKLFVEHSPLYNADKIQTPLLLLHGTKDTNVPTQQSQAMFTALKILNKPVAYVTFENENHVLHDFKKRMAWQQIINAWFAKWLKNQPQWWESLYPNEELQH